MLGAFALVTVFGLAWHIRVMTFQSLRRGILNQHVMVEATSFAGLAGGIYGVTAGPKGFPPGGFFAVAVLAENYHIFSVAVADRQDEEFAVGKAAARFAARHSARRYRW